MARHPDSQAWLDALPAVVADLLERWDLRLDGAPYTGGIASLALPVRDTFGAPLVLKVQWPHRECRHEAAALAAWDGRGAVRLVAHDPLRHALLLERAEPGAPLHTLEHDAAVDAAIRIAEQLLACTPPPDHPFDTAAGEAATWATDIAERSARLGHPIDRGIVEHAVAFAHDRAGAGSAGGALVHQDLHAGNVVSAQRQPWLAIDPKPLVGDRELIAIALVRGDELGLDPALMRRRLDRLTAALELDRERVRDWAITQTLAWGAEADRWMGERRKVELLLAL